MAPVDLEVLLHYVGSCEQHPKFDTPFVRKAIETFLTADILFHDKPNNNPSSITLTSRGEAWLKMLLQTPYPRQVWVDQNNEIIG